MIKKLKNKILFFRYVLFFLSTLSFFLPKINSAQSLAYKYKTITASFLYEEVNFANVAVVTNVLKLKNNNGKTYTLSVSINVPPGWKTLNNENRIYELKPNDSLYIPVRILSSNKKSKGGTKYSIAAYINTNEGKQMAFARFLAGRPKISNWQMHILPRPRIYFLNGESNAGFQLNLVNEGDEAQDLLISFQKIGKELLLKDTLDRILKKNYLEMSLKPYSDTTLHYNVQSTIEKLNQRRIDNWSYSPNEIQREKRFGLFIKAADVTILKGKTDTKGKKVEFVRLTNSIDFVKLNNSTIAGNGSNTIPLSIFLNVNNLFGQQPIANLNLFGNTEIGKYSSLSYNVLTSFQNYFYTKNYYNVNLGGNLTYSYKKAVFGLFTGGQLASLSNVNERANTIMFGYRFTKNLFVSTFLSRPAFFSISNKNGYGLNVRGAFRRLQYNLNGFYIDRSNSGNQYFIGSNFNFPITNKISQGLSFMYRLNLINPSNSSTSYNIGLNQSYNFKVIRLNLNYRILQSNNNNLLFNSNVIRNFLRFSVNTRFKKGINFTLNSTISTSNTIGLINGNNGNSSSFFNILSIRRTKSKINKPFQLAPSFYQNYTRRITDTILGFGLQFGIMQNNMDKNLFLSGNIRAGYTTMLTKLYNSPYFFNIQSNVLARYKVWNLLLNYNYGTSFSNDIVGIVKNTSSTVYPQSVRVNLSHQYLFKNKKFIAENALNVFYINVNKRTSYSLMSQLYYYTSNFTRFGINVNYNLVSSLPFSRDRFANLNQDIKKVNNSSYFIGCNIKKDLFIPLPKRFRNSKYCDAKFIVFLDVNGNKKMDEGEVPVENVVLRMNDFEVITNEQGAANFINISFAKYAFQVLPLIDVGAWFPNVSDSLEVCGPEPIYIPFSKGVHVYGNVELDREAISGSLFEKLDVSRFKIYLIDSTGKTFSSITDMDGNFNFYVPYEKYVLKFDEKALGSSFYLPENDIDLDLRSGIESYYHHFLIIEKKRKIKKKIFGPDGKITYVEEEAGSKKSDKDKIEEDENSTDEKNKDKSGKDANKDGISGSDGINGLQIIEAKFKQLDSLLDVLNRMIARAATKPDVRAIVRQEMQLLIEELNATFTIVIDELPKGKNPTGILLQLVRMKKVEEIKLPNGNKLYFSGDYKNVTDAEKFCRDFQTSGFRKAKVAKRNTIVNQSK